MIEGLGSDVTRIVATHDVEKAILADRVVIMREGSIVACGSPEKLINSHSFLRDVNKDKSIVLIFIQRHYLILDRFGMIQIDIKSSSHKESCNSEDYEKDE